MERFNNLVFKMPVKNILIRTAGGKARGKELGLGHIYRTINLAKELSIHNIFFLVEDYGGVTKILNENGFNNVVSLNKNFSYNDDFLKTRDYVIKKNIDLVIFDKYKINKNYIKKFTKFVKTIVISDLCNTNYDSNLLVNGFIGFKNQKIQKNSTKFLLGPKYQILDKRFKNITSKKFIYPRKYKKLLLTVGGFDENNIIEIFLKIILKYIESFHVTVILGPATKFNTTLEKFQLNYSNNFKIISSTNNMKKEILNCDFGICSGGLTSYEFATLGKPFAIICQSPHQILTARQWEHLGIAYNLGNPNMRINSKIKTLMENLVSNNINLRIKSSKYLDGKGSLRVAKEISLLLKN